MGIRTIIEINHDYLHSLVNDHHDRKELDRFLLALGATLADAKELAPNGIRVLAQRDSYTPITLKVD